MQNRLAELSRKFDLPGTVKSVETLRSGNINCTYDVMLDDNGTEHRYIFQKINVFVFKNPVQIMQNIEQITAHIAQKIAASGESANGVMHFAHTADGKNYYMGEDEFWRAYEFVPNTVTFDTCSDPKILTSAGRAFGHFQTLLSDFDAQKLFTTIPDFHNTRKRLETFFAHVEEDPCGRVEEVRAEINAIAQYRTLALRLNALVDAGELPFRVTHNDTKINNVLFDQDTGEATTVIDLDTVMPGLVAHDFGDAIRFAANSAAEDEPDLTKVHLDMERFRAFAAGFIPEVQQSLRETELKTLALGAFTITVEQASRFLDDYITGDHYFKTLYDGHNLVRTRCQLKLAEDMFRYLPEMERTIETIVHASR